MAQEYKTAYTVGDLVATLQGVHPSTLVVVAINEWYRHVAVIRPDAADVELEHGETTDGYTCLTLILTDDLEPRDAIDFATSEHRAHRYIHVSAQR